MTKTKRKKFKGAKSFLIIIEYLTPMGYNRERCKEIIFKYGQYLDCDLENRSNRILWDVSQLAASDMEAFKEYVRSYIKPLTPFRKLRTYIKRECKVQIAEFFQALTDYSVELKIDVNDYLKDDGRPNMEYYEMASKKIYGDLPKFVEFVNSKKNAVQTT